MGYRDELQLNNLRTPQLLAALLTLNAVGDDLYFLGSLKVTQYTLSTLFTFGGHLLTEPQNHWLPPDDIHQALPNEGDVDSYHRRTVGILLTVSSVSLLLAQLDSLDNVAVNRLPS